MALRSFADGALFAEAFGAGNPRVLALHGWRRRGADFGRSLQDLPALAPDLPGFGASPPPDAVIGASGYADRVSVLLDHFDEPPVVVGHSFGGRVAVCLAAALPDRVGPIVLTGVPLVRTSRSTAPSVGYRLLRSLNRAGVVSDASMERVRRSRGSADYVAAEGVMRDILVKVVNETYEVELGEIRSAVHMVWGGDDAEAPVSVARRAADIIEEAAHTSVELVVLEGVGHLVPVEAPDELRKAITSLME